jgi:hypothetical protein
MFSYADRVKTIGAAKSLLTRQETRAKKFGREFNRDDYAIAERTDFKQNIEKTRTTGNILNPKAGTWEIPVNTPASCDPGTETYHSM